MVFIAAAVSERMLDKGKVEWKIGLRQVLVELDGGRYRNIQHQPTYLTVDHGVFEAIAVGSRSRLGGLNICGLRHVFRIRWSVG